MKAGAARSVATTPAAAPTACSPSPHSAVDEGVPSVRSSQEGQHLEYRSRELRPGTVPAFNDASAFHVLVVAACRECHPRLRCAAVTTLANVTGRVDRFIVDYAVVILAIVNTGRPSPLHRRDLRRRRRRRMLEHLPGVLGFEAEIPRDQVATVLDILQKPLDEAL